MKQQELELGPIVRALEGHIFGRVLGKRGVDVCLADEGFRLAVTLAVRVVS